MKKQSKFVIVLVFDVEFLYQFLDFWASGFVEFCNSEFLDLKTFGFLNSWIFEFWDHLFITSIFMSLFKYAWCSNFVCVPIVDLLVLALLMKSQKNSLKESSILSSADYSQNVIFLPSFLWSSLEEQLVIACMKLFSLD